MTHIKVSKGLDIPIKGKPLGENIGDLAPAEQVALNLDVYEDVKFKLLVRAGDVVKIGQPLAMDKKCPERLFVSPASGVVDKVVRGAKRRLRYIVIKVAADEQHHELPKLDPSSASKEELINLMLEGGIFSRIYQRPFNVLARPSHLPRSIFVKAVETGPFSVSAELQVRGYETEFQSGLTALSKLTEGSVHLVHKKGSQSEAFVKAQDVTIHTVEGVHPAGDVSLHIQEIDPIESVEDVIWTVNVVDVIVLGHLLLTGRHHIESVISVAGTGIHEDRRGFFRAREGYPVGGLVANRTVKGLVRLISGGVLTGIKVEVDEFLGMRDTVFCAIRENVDRELLHFFRPGFSKFSNSRTYVSGLTKGGSKTYEFTTNQHGEERAFVESSVYNNVTPLDIPVMHLVKAILSEDWEGAEAFGLLNVAPEDLALPTFVCPCKIEMVDILKKALSFYAQESL